MGNLFCCGGIEKPVPLYASFLKRHRNMNGVPSRFVVLDGGVIEYFESQNPTLPTQGMGLKGNINLYEFVLAPYDPKSPLTLKFVRSNNPMIADSKVATTSSRLDNYEFECKSVKERVDWVEGVNKHTEYMCYLYAQAGY